METRRGYSVLCFVAHFGFWASANALLSPKVSTLKVMQALMRIRDSLDDPHGVLENWDVNAVDPCSWTMMLLQNNNISGPIPTELGMLPKLQYLKSLQYLRLNNNSLSGSIPFSLPNMTQLAFLLMGNPMICATGTEKDCNGTTAMPLSYPLNNAQIKKIHQEKKLDMLVDEDLKNNYDRIELEEMVQVVLPCTQYLPSYRPKMSKVVRILEGDGLAEKWEALQRADTTRCRANEFFLQSGTLISQKTHPCLSRQWSLSGPQ
ncbi:unnamed protein product [Camellia sinensis]